MKKSIVTTALEESWPEEGKVLFLGEWCRRYSQRDRWEKLNADVLPYHWDDREKLYTDYQYLQELSERLLIELTAQLNVIHKVDYTIRYWRILIGPWLSTFTQILFDRWASVQLAVEQQEGISETIVLLGLEEALIPNDIGKFLLLLAGDNWNHLLYSIIFQEFTDVVCVKRAWRNPDYEVKPEPVWANWQHKIKQNIFACAVRGTKKLMGDEDAFLLSTYLSYFDELRMQWRLGQVPQFWRSAPAPIAPVDRNRREWVVSGESRSAFEVCIRSMIPRQMPVVYLEGYDKLVERTMNLSWPKRPKLIWTSVKHMGDDVFKAWAARCVEQGSPLVIGQHGGHYGIGQWSSVEEHEIEICDAYLSWGWTDASQPKVKAIGQLKPCRPLRVTHEEKKRLLLVCTFVPRYSYRMFSCMVSRQWLDYFSDQCSFVRALTSDIRSSLTVRLAASDIDYGWDEIMRWRDCFPDLHLDDGQVNIKNLLGQSKLCISTYNATTFLESFTMDIPTVIFWNSDHWELRDSARPYLDDLKRVGIFHETPESAARHVLEIWDHVSIWWASESVREVLDRFKAQYCDLPNNFLSRIESTLRRVAFDKELM